MKHKGQQFQYQDLFIRDLLSTYKRLKAEHLNRYGRINRLLLFRAVCNSPAKRFYTSEEQAARIIRGMLAGKQYPKMKPLTREMYLEIFSRVQSRLRVKKTPITPLIEKILNEPAPKFYITPQSLEIKLNKLKETHRHYEHRQRP